MNWKKAFEELGKGFINFSIGLTLFLIVQPFVKGKLTEEYLLVGIISALFFLVFGFTLILFSGGSNNDT